VPHRRDDNLEQERERHADSADDHHTAPRAEFPGDRYATVMVLIENAEGAPRHTHPGLEMTYILEGEYVLSVDGRADQVLKPGDWFEVPAEVPHSVQCLTPGRALGHYVVEKDKPLVSWL
jgi:quercetin dioxygenase-like cupin family protein